MICRKCKNEKTRPDERYWEDYPDWCKDCIRVAMNHKFRLLQSQGYFMRLAGRSEEEVLKYIETYWG